MAVQNNERGPAFRQLEYRERLFDSGNVIGIADSNNVPAVGEKARGHVFGECDVRVPFDADVIVVPNPAEIIQTEMTGERGSFGSNAFHHATVTADGVDVVVEDFKTWFVVWWGEPFLGNGHANAGRDTLSERAGGGFHSRDPMIFRMAWRFAVELPKPANIGQADRWMSDVFIGGVHRLDAGKVKSRPEQHGSVAIRKDESVAVRPDRVLRIKTHDAIPNRINQRGQRHWCTGMSGSRLLDCVDGKRADRVDRQLSHLL